MARNRWLKPLIVAGIFFALCALSAFNPPDPNHPAEPGPWFSIVPALLAISMALATGRIMISLVASVLLGGFLTTIPADPTSVVAWLRGPVEGFLYVYSSVTDPVNIQILAFVVLIMAMISVMVVAGGLQGVVIWLSRFARGPRSAQLVTALMGLALFIDDYANTMIVGASMRHLTDRYGVSREKLAFLVDATSAPVAGLAVISTWVGYEVGLFNDASLTLGLGQDGYSMLFDILPYRFYCILMIVFVFAVVLTRRDFGPMRKAELRARRTGKLGADDAAPMTSNAFVTAQPDPSVAARAIVAVIPVTILFAVLFGGIWFDGGGGAKLSQSPLSLVNPVAWRDTIGDAENSIMILAISAAVGVAVSWLCAGFISRLSVPKMAVATVRGMQSSLLPVIILSLAWSLKAVCDHLAAGAFMVAAVGDVLSPVWFPLLIFFIAALTSFATGTSYGTMGILIPIALPLALQLDGGAYGLITILSLGAILDGSIFGDHCSPISDTTIMSSIASSCDHFHHVRTQLPYSVLVGLVAMFVGYLGAARNVPSWILILVGAAGLVGILFLFSQGPVEADEKTSAASDASIEG